MASIPQMVYQGIPTITTNAAPTFGAINKYDASSGALSVTLPALSSLNPGVSCILQKNPGDLTSNTITFIPNGSDAFDNGAPSVYLTQPGEIKVLQKISITGANLWMITNTVADTSPYWALQSAGQICTLPRIQLNTGLQLVSGTLHLAYFQAPNRVSALTISNVAVSTGDVAAAGVTLAEIGIFSGLFRLLCGSGLGLMGGQRQDLSYARHRVVPASVGTGDAVEGGASRAVGSRRAGGRVGGAPGPDPVRLPGLRYVAGGV